MTFMCLQHLQEITGLSLLSSTAPCDSDASSQHWQRLISSGMCNCAFYCHIIRKDSQQVCWLFCVCVFENVYMCWCGNLFCIL